MRDLDMPAIDEVEVAPEVVAPEPTGEVDRTALRIALADLPIPADIGNEYLDKHCK